MLTPPCSSAERPVTNFETDASAASFAARYRADGLHGGHVILLSQDAASVAAARDALAAFPGGLHLGGGVTAESAGGWLDAGASHVVVTSYVFRDGGLDAQRLQALVRRAAGAARAGCPYQRLGGDDKTTLRRSGGPNQAAWPTQAEKTALKRLAIDPRLWFARQRAWRSPRNICSR